MWKHEQPKAEMWTGQRFDVAQHKVDGWRATVFIQRDRSIQIWGLEHEPHLEFCTRFPRLLDDDTIKLMRKAPPLTSFDCEFMTMDAQRSKVTTALRDVRIPIRILPFAVPYYDGVDQRGLQLETAQRQCDDLGIPFAPFQRWLCPDPFDVEATKKALLDEARARSIEGWILKRDGQYGKWYKVKQELFADCVIVGTKDGEGKYSGKIGALVLAVYDDSTGTRGPRGTKIVANCSGMTDAERDAMTALRDKNQLVGFVVEVKYQMIGTGGRLTHPRFVRWRPDKPAQECILSRLAVS